MVKDIFIFYYLPISMFVFLFYSILLISVIYMIKKHFGTIPVLLYFIALTSIWIMYIYPINVYINVQQYIVFIIIILIGIFNIMTMATSERIDGEKPLNGTLFPLMVKTAVILFVSMVLSKNIHHNNILIITTIDAILSSSIIFMMPKNVTHCRIQIPHRGMFMIMILMTIVYCITVTYTSEIEFILLFVLMVISASNLIVLSIFLIHVCSTRINNNVYSYEGQLYNNGKYDLLIKMIKEHVNENYTSPIDKYTIALQCEKHPDYISKLFKNEEGITINKYIQKVRIEKAFKLLLETDKKIIEVAFEVGYENLATFYRHFIQQHKKSPQQLRKEKNIFLNYSL